MSSWNVEISDPNLSLHLGVVGLGFGLLIAPIKVDFFYATLSITAVALGSGAAGALNMWYESDVDSIMSRTCLRPIPAGKLTFSQFILE